MDRLRKILITGLGTGYLRPAPGTWGSAAVCGVFGLLLWAAGPQSWILAGAMAVIVILAAAGCVAWGEWAETTFGEKDPSHCTLDEWAGQAVALIHIPLGLGWSQHGLAVAVAFFAFRLFDIIKPPPAYQSQKFAGGMGIVADDLIAGIYANIAAQIILRLAPSIT